jgi:hypothetical protein
MIYIIFLLNIQNISVFVYCLSFVQGLKYKWLSIQEPRLMMEYKSLIKTALGLSLVRLKLG